MGMALAYNPAVGSEYGQSVGVYLMLVLIGVRQELQRSTALYLQMAPFLFSQSSGYGMECSNFMKGVGTKLASSGYAVFGIDYEGHGRSMGARCYIKRFDNIVNDCSDHFKSICAQEEYREKRRFLYGESMGGAVALLTHKKDPGFWHGAILVAPMCKISEKLKPHPVVISLLTAVEDVIPKWKIVPTKDVIDSAFKDPIKREEIRSNKLIYQQKPRLKTALEMLRTSMNLEDSLNEVTLPFFVLHGEADIVTDPEVSRALYEQASSSDKTIKLYPGMWHGLTAGEPDGNIEIVFSDIISWLDRRAGDEGSTLSMKSIKHSTPSPTMPDGLTAMASPMSLKKQKHAKKCSNAKYLCGLKGRGFYHHSAV
ncbi:UNVERIFIED_CONTAM: Caffeoylshikimate esterase [Sesamum latifolium]|uniref:Caffeoylshikimate esterase n=1 Tax=Sesamum latifolium TaxID=2727402 RepID=A0AAW2Y1V8_9LAMI